MNHFHQYERLTWDNGKVYYKCQIISCNHYLPHAQLAEGRESLCWGECNRLVVITKEMIKSEIKKPMCDDCREKRKEKRRELAKL